MDLYGWLRTIHMIGAALLFVSLGLEAVAARRLRRSKDADRAHSAFRTVRRAGRAGSLAAAAILIPGVWMMALRWGPVSWIVTALVGIAIMAVVSLRTRPAVKRLGAMLAEAPARAAIVVPASLGNTLASSLWLRASVAIGILALMGTKPGWLGSAAIVGVAVLAGVAGALLSARGTTPRLAEATAPTDERQLTR